MLCTLDNQDPRWVPALIVKRQGSHMFHVRVVPKGPIWRRHLNQLQTRYVSDSNNNIEGVPSTSNAVQEPTSNLFTLKKKSLTSSFT